MGIVTVVVVRLQQQQASCVMGCRSHSRVSGQCARKGPGGDGMCLCLSCG